MPETNTVLLRPQELADKATARANELVRITATVAGLDLDEREQAIVSLGIGLGVSSYTAVLKAEASPQQEAETP